MRRVNRGRWWAPQVARVPGSADAGHRGDGDEERRLLDRSAVCGRHREYRDTVRISATDAGKDQHDDARNATTIDEKETHGNGQYDRQYACYQ